VEDLAVSRESVRRVWTDHSVGLRDCAFPVLRHRSGCPRENWRRTRATPRPHTFDRVRSRWKRYLWEGNRGAFDRWSAVRLIS